MEKKIKLIMDENKNIHICLNEEEKHVIYANDRKIAAIKIFQMLNHSISDVYEVTSDNATGQDPRALEFFEKLLKEITSKIQDIKFME